jgi:hypothetical protein
LTQSAWLQVVLAMAPLESTALLSSDDKGKPQLPLGTLQLIEVLTLLCNET